MSTACDKAASPDPKTSDTEENTIKTLELADHTKSSKNVRKVCFPEDDGDLVTKYFEPPNPWHDVSPTSREQLILEYIESCKKHKTEPLECILEQIKELPENSIGGQQRAPRLTIDAHALIGCAPIDALEAVLSKVQFVRVHLENTGLDGEAAEALFDMIEYYESANTLALIGAREFGIRGWQAASRMIKKSAALSELETSDAPLEASHCAVIARALRPQSCCLTALTVQRANLAGEPLLCLLIALKCSSCIRELRLCDNKLSQSDAIQLASLLRANTGLRLLDLSNNMIQDAGVAHIADALVDQASLTPPSGTTSPISPQYYSQCGYEPRGLAFLVLWNNQLTRNCANHLSKALRSSQSLSVLNIGRNALGSDSVRTLKWVGSLVCLGLQAARLGPEAAKSLAEIIRGNRLQRLDLRDNKLGSVGLNEIATAMKDNTTLTQIDLDDHTECERLLSEIRAFCVRNSRDAPPPPHRKISLTCHTLAKPVLLCESPRGGRLRSPTPSPAPSPAGSPVPPHQGQNRFSVTRVTPERESSTDSNASSPSTPTKPMASRFKVVQVSRPLDRDSSSESTASSPSTPPTPSRFKVMQVIEPPKIHVQPAESSPRTSRFSVTRNYDTTYTLKHDSRAVKNSDQSAHAVKKICDKNLEHTGDVKVSDKNTVNAGLGDRNVVKAGLSDKHSVGIKSDKVTELVLSDKNDLETVKSGKNIVDFECDKNCAKVVTSDKNTADVDKSDNNTQVATSDKSIAEKVTSDSDTVKTVTIDKNTEDVVKSDDSKVETVKQTIESVTSDKNVIEPVTSNKTTLETVSSDKYTLETVSCDKQTFDSVISDKPSLVTVASDKNVVKSDNSPIATVPSDKITANAAKSDRNTTESVTSDEKEVDSDKKPSDSDESVFKFDSETNEVDNEPTKACADDDKRTEVMNTDSTVKPTDETKNDDSNKALKQIEAITEDLGNLIKEMKEITTKTKRDKETATCVPVKSDIDLKISGDLLKRSLGSNSSLETSDTEVLVKMSAESSLESNSNLLTTSVSSNECVSPLSINKNHGSLSSLEAGVSSLDSSRERVMVTSTDSGIENSFKNLERDSSNEGTLTNSSLKDLHDTLTESPKRTASLLDVPALKNKGLDRMRKISWGAPSPSFYIPKEAEKVETKMPSHLEKLLSLFQHPSSLFSREEEKKTSSTKKDIASSFWSWGNIEKSDSNDRDDSISDNAVSDLSERQQVSYIDESFSKRLDRKTSSTDTDTLSEFQSYMSNSDLESSVESIQATVTTDRVQSLALSLDSNDLIDPNDVGACKDSKIDVVRPGSFASVLKTTENTDRLISPDSGQPIDKLPSKVIRGIKENISPENTLTSSMTNTKTLALEMSESEARSTVVNALWDVTVTKHDLDDGAHEKQDKPVDLGKDALSFLYANQDFVEKEAVTEEISKKEDVKSVDLSPELIMDDAVFVDPTKPMVPLKKSNSLENLKIEEDSPKTKKNIAFKIPETSSTPRDIPRPRKLRSRSGSSPKSLPECFKQSSMSKFDHGFCKKKKRVSSLGKIAKDSLLKLNMTEEEIVEYRRSHKWSVESLKSLESVSEDASASDSKCRCHRLSQESLMSLDSISEDCKCHFRDSTGSAR